MTPKDLGFSYYIFKYQPIGLRTVVLCSIHIKKQLKICSGDATDCKVNDVKLYPPLAVREHIGN